MALLEPLNDKRCLQLLHDEMRKRISDARIQSFARQFHDLDDVVIYVRSLEQRDDLGDPEDGPRVACEISQRFRNLPSDPNCVERVGIYLPLAEILDPETPRSSATMVLDEGWHTFPVEFRDGRPHVVVLDPIAPPRNAMLATAYRARRVSPTASQNLAPWFEQVARNACYEDGGEECYEYAIDSLRNALITGDAPAHFDDIEYVLSRAAEDAEYFGGQGRAAVRQVHRSLRNLSIKLDKGIVSRFVDHLTSTAEKLAPEAIKVALVSQFGPAAAIALQGVDLAIEDSKNAPPVKPAQPARPAQQEEKVGTLGLSLEGSNGQAGQAEDKPARSGPKDIWNRMTKVFRPQTATTK